MLKRISEAHEDSPSQYELSCPLLSKISEAYHYAHAAHTRRPLAHGFKQIDCKLGAALQVGFRRENGILVLAFRTPTANPDANQELYHRQLNGSSWQENEPPHWLSSAIQGVEVHAPWLHIFNEFLMPPQQLKKPALSKVIKQMTGKTIPRRIICTGFCIGGAVATLAACWAGLQWPTADVRCITFGAPRVGNSQFVEAFRWLVSTSYRVLSYKDPVPSKSKPKLSTLHHVVRSVALLNHDAALLDKHGPIYVSETAFAPGKQPNVATLSRGMQFHRLEVYGRDLLRHVRDCSQAEHDGQGGACRALIDPAHFCAKQKVRSQRNLALLAGEVPTVTWPAQAALLGGFDAPSESNTQPDTWSDGTLTPAASGDLDAGPSGAGQSQGLVRKPSRSSAALRPVSRDPEATDHGAAEQQAAGGAQVGAGLGPDEEPEAAAAAAVAAAAAARSRSAHSQSLNGLQAGNQQGSPAADGKAGSSTFASRREDALHGSGQQEPSAASFEAGSSSLREGGRDAVEHSLTAAERDDVKLPHKLLRGLPKVVLSGKVCQSLLLAQAAGCDDATSFQRLTDVTNSKLVVDPLHEQTQVHVGWLDAGTAVFAFAGTHSEDQGLQDVQIVTRSVNYLQQRFPGAKAHSGYLQQLAALCDPARPDFNAAAVLRELSGGRWPGRVICCGHSSGAAVATLGALWASMEWPNSDVRCITFGSPKVGNATLGKAVRCLVGCSVRVVNGRDPLPALPSALTFQHVDNGLHLNQEAATLAERSWRFNMFTNAEHHALDRYASCILRHVPATPASSPYKPPLQFPEEPPPPALI